MIFFKPRKAGWSYKGRRGLRDGGGNCLKYLQRGCNRKEERGNKHLKKWGGGGKLGQGVGALKMGGWGGEQAGTGTPSKVKSKLFYMQMGGT